MRVELNLSHNQKFELKIKFKRRKIIIVVIVGSNLQKILIGTTISKPDASTDNITSIKLFGKCD